MTYLEENYKMLKEINDSLRPDKCDKTGKIGIFLFGQAGDLATATAVLKYRKELWPNKEIIWFCNLPNAELLKYAPIDQVRPYPWGGNGLPIGEECFHVTLCNSENRLNLELAKNYELTADLEDGYFPAPHMMTPQQRHGLEYPNVSKKVFGVPDDWEWHPCLEFSEEDYDLVDLFLEKVGKGKIVCIETFAGSGQSLLDEGMITKAMTLCMAHWGDCNFIFASHKFLRGNEAFPDYLIKGYKMYWCPDFTVRQCALIAGSSDLIISVSSGITVADSCWHNRPTPILQFCGSSICSTRAIALGRFELITADERSLDTAKEEFYSKLKSLLHE